MLECRYSGMCDVEMRDGECDGCGNFKHPDWFHDCIGYEPMPDVGALLELADEMTVEKGDIWGWSSCIREALGVRA